MSMVHASRGTLDPASPHLKSEPLLVASLAKATLPDTVVDWDKMTRDYSNIRQAIEAVFPGFENYNQRIQQPGGFSPAQWRIRAHLAHAVRKSAVPGDGGHQ